MPVYALRSDRFAQNGRWKPWQPPRSGGAQLQDAYKAYEEGKSGLAVDTYVISATSFTNQPVELNAGDWTADDFGVRGHGKL